MLIQCTKKLLTELKVTPAPALEESSLFSWHANLLTVNRKRTLVLMNDSSRYIIVLYGLKAKELKNLNELILQALKETFQKEGIKDDVIETYISSSSEITYTTTKNRTLVSRLNKACESVLYFEEDINQSEIIQTQLSKRLSRLLVGNGKNDYTQPNQELYKDLENLISGPIFHSEAFVLNVKLDLKHHNVWRKIIVPKNITFPELHETLQQVFGWTDSHLHEFIVFEKSSTFGKPMVKLICHEELLNQPSDVPMKLETEGKFLDYLPAVVQYHYDFGDSWKHEIVIEKMIDQYDKNYPTCIEYEGVTPPEDVGGEHGYEEFLTVISNPNHPDCEHMKSWARSQGYKEEFDMKWVNRLFKNM